MLTGPPFRLAGEKKPSGRNEKAACETKEKIKTGGRWYVLRVESYICETRVFLIITPPETNKAPENWWLEEDFAFRNACFQGLR